MKAVAEKPTTRERPIIFSAPMVRAILEGRKTQTRRVVTPQPEVKQGLLDDPGMKTFRVQEGPGTYRHLGKINFAQEFCRHGVAGNRLWVRETWRDTITRDGKCCVAYEADGEARLLLCEHEGEGDPHHVGRKCKAWVDEKSQPKWKSSRYMPHWASRLTLEVLSVQIERVQKINAADAIAEGVEHLTPNGWWGGLMNGTAKVCRANAEMAFADRWDAINAARGHAWKNNPWVWCISFKVAS